VHDGDSNYIEENDAEHVIVFAGGIDSSTRTLNRETPSITLLVPVNRGYFEEWQADQRDRNGEIMPRPCTLDVLRTTSARPFYASTRTRPTSWTRSEGRRTSGR